jgi:hypothetical protein
MQKDASQEPAARQDQVGIALRVQQRGKRAGTDLHALVLVFATWGDGRAAQWQTREPGRQRAHKLWFCKHIMDFFCLH